MNDSELHANDPFTDDDEPMTWEAGGLFMSAAEAAGIALLRLPPALPSYADVLKALGNPSAPLAAIAALQAENALYRRLLQDVLEDDEIAYSEIEYALTDEHPGAVILTSLADAKAERDRLRDKLQAQVDDFDMHVADALRPVYQAAGVDPQMGEPNDVVEAIAALRKQAAVGALLARWGGCDGND